MYISQYLPSSVTFVIDGVQVQFENYSIFPEDKNIRFRISVSSPVEFPLCFRTPAWATGKNSYRVNGSETTPVSNDRGWMEIKRQWRGGDIIEINYEFMLKFKAADDHHPDIVALCYGPFVLAADSMTLLKGDVHTPETWIHPVEGEYCVFETDAGHVAGYNSIRRRFKPYYRIPEMEWYYLYCRIINPQNV
ncbi:hypothetical protein FACS1894163_13750 [Spirochaetia bacterium]|nr:hypothetical protein FACS1894163_13750 [Spirochaetia bacterium]